MREAVGDVEMLAVAWRRPDPAKAPQLADEYERLFVGPGPVPCPPYESYWRDDVPPLMRRSLMGPCVDVLNGLYAQIGLQVRRSSGELPDHIAVELEALYLAAAHPVGDGVAGALVREHLAVWVPSFCDAVLRETSDDSYRDLATATRDLVCRDVRLLERGFHDLLIRVTGIDRPPPV